MPNQEEESTEDQQQYVHHDITTDLVDPTLIEIDEVNERDIAPGPRTDVGDLEKSIREDGIHNPPQVRPSKSDKFKYKVFAGQRRVLAAQSIESIEEIPVIVKDLDDTEAIAASVNENNPHLQKNVHRKDRAIAVKEVVDDWGYEKATEYFGVTRPTISGWLEPLNDFWAGTFFDPNEISEVDDEYIADDILKGLRLMFTKSETAEAAAKKIIQRKVPPGVVRSALSATENEENFWNEIKEQWEAIGKGKERINVSFVLTGAAAKNLDKYSKEIGVSKEKAAQSLVEGDLDGLYEGGDGDVSVRFLLQGKYAEKLRTLIEGRNTTAQAVVKKIVEKKLDDWVD